MHMQPSSALLRSLLTSALVLASASALAIGIKVTTSQESLIQVGMTRAEVQAAIGRPSKNIKFPKQPGRTWTYEVLDQTDPEKTTRKLFDVDFGSDDKVTRTGERVLPPMK